MEATHNINYEGLELEIQESLSKIAIWVIKAGGLTGE
jgi:hypothetical protein